MKFLILFTALCTASTTFAAFDIKPGLWEVKMQMTLDGKAFDPMAEMNKALEQLPPEQRKKMEAMLAGSDKIPVTKNGYRICYTADMLKSPNKVMEGTKACTTKITTQTAKKLAGTFDCPKDDAKGDFEWNAKSSNEYEGLMNGKTSKGGNTQVRYQGKFISADCGKVKPVL
ncbi:hypothetical protein Bb109J_c2153 [Bdellovibrio bacteriovorus]|uniref:DUF3617 domain-containing protein n=1 Tax=Bdellovibrio bacteriovorus TaxID=959 RepID=UPI00045BFB65|nr:DUF3617 domain-containing protein [Bdellovibrio bacteriovorus]AHZ84847.1 hypothetical protein EP01_07845 [Bdellovibrio bacteriovorus]BEV68733.1 hypothetical protein Bb109J_c2153 [Bdellovibrio bacteriovorus]